MFATDGAVCVGGANERPMTRPTTRGVKGKGGPIRSKEGGAEGVHSKLRKRVDSVPAATAGR